uniref:Uncharacterized protein n=1 Tax=Panagrolaimus sp. ES5 TaxID=591445 RepID=A0AC34FMZ0_9BILA
MATKNPFSSLQNEKYNFGDGKSVFDNDRYRDLNLNRYHTTSSNDDIIRSKSCSSPDSRKSDPFIDYIMEGHFDDSKMGENSNEWNKNNLMMEFEDDRTEKDKKRSDNKNSSRNSSTLSLRIASYGNSIDTVNQEDKSNEFIENQKEFGSKWKSVKHFIADSASSKMSENPFEFPHQQKKQNQKMDPEVMEFTASKQLLNPNQRPAIQYPESESDDEEEYAKILEKPLQSRVVVVASKKSKPKTFEKEEMKLLERKSEIKIEKERLKQKFSGLECFRAIELEKRVLNEIRERIHCGRDVGAVLFDDLKYCQKRSLNAFEEHHDVHKKYKAIKDEQDRIYQKLRDFHHHDKK